MIHQGGSNSYTENWTTENGTASITERYDASGNYMGKDYTEFDQNGNVIDHSEWDSDGNLVSGSGRIDVSVSEKEEWGGKAYLRHGVTAEANVSRSTCLEGRRSIQLSYGRPVFLLLF